MSDNSLEQSFNKLVILLIDNLSTFGLPDDFREEHIQYPNLHFVTPKNFPWLRITLNPVGQISTDASGCYEVNGCFYTISLFYPKTTGNTSLLRIMENIKRIYHLYQVDDVVVENANIASISEPENSPWYGMKVEVYFTYEGFTI